MFSKLTLSMAVASGGKCPFGFDNDSSVSSPVHPKVRSSAAYPSEIFTCPNLGGVAIATTTTFDQDKYKEVFNEILTKYEAIDAAVSANSNPRAKFAGCIVRTAGHDFMDYRIDADGSTSGGSDGCIDFADSDNTGLADCLEDSDLVSVF